MALRDLPIFNGTDNQYDRLIEQISPAYYAVDSGETILAQGDVYDSLLALISGACYAEMLDSRGKVLRIESFCAPYLFAPAVLFASDNRMPGSVFASKECRIARISRSDLLKLCTLSEIVLENLLRITSDKFIFLSNRLSFLSFRTIREKTIRYLEMLEVTGNEFVELDMPLEKLAEFFGVTRPSLSRAFSELEATGYIERTGKRVRILKTRGE